MLTSSCSRFRRLSNHSLDKELASDEGAFLVEHASKCAFCSEYHNSNELIFELRGFDLGASVSDTFDRRVIRKLNIQIVQESLRFWSPALIGAAIAGIAFLAIIQSVVQPKQMPAFVPGVTEARIHSSGSLPEFPPIERDASDILIP